MADHIIGIDLGTTNSVVACVINGKPQVLRGASDTADIVPSCVGVGADGDIIVGQHARNQLVAAPERTVASIKRQMGNDYQVMLGDQCYTPVEISAFILKNLKERAEAALGQPVDKAVITVPAYFTDAQRQATRAAGAIAGLEVVRIINEPTAAALSYNGANRERAKVLVYDLGGGTFDVSVVNVEAGVVEVLATAGDNRLGGDDFDEATRANLVGHLQEEHQLDVQDDRKAMARLLRASEVAKIQLSKEPYAQVIEDHIGTQSNNAVHLNHELSRQDFLETIDKYLERTMEATSRALIDAQVRPSELDKVLLVGGSSRIPRVRELLRERLGHEPHDEVDPDLSVALGAAVQGAMEAGTQVDAVLVDVTPYTFGVSCIGSLYGQPYAHQFVPLIRRNSKLPAEHSEVFLKTRPEQEEIVLEVYQGEDPDALKNERIGEFSFTGLRDSQRAHERGLVVTFGLDTDGILRVRATERETNKVMHCQIDNVTRQSDDEVIASGRDKIAQLWTPREEVVKPAADAVHGEVAAAEVTPLVLPPELHAVVQRAHEALDKVSEDDQAELISLIEDVHVGHEGGVSDAVQKAKAQIEEILFYLE